MMLSSWSSKADKHREAASGAGSRRDVIGCCSNMLYFVVICITKVGELLA